MANKTDDRPWIKAEASPTWNFETEPEFIGTYVSKEENVGPNNSNLYNFKKEDGSQVAVWGNALLDTRFKNFTPGEEVKIEYLGKQKSEKTQREYHNFDVWHRPAPFQKVEGSEEVNPEDIPF